MAIPAPFALRLAPLRPLAELAGAAAAGLFAAAFVWTLARPIGPFGAPPPAALGSGQPADLAALARVDPFFRADSAAAPGGDLSQLGLILFAVRNGGADGGGAIIQVAGRGQRSFSIGDEVAPGVRLTAVSPGAVTLSQGGAAMELAFPTPASPAPGLAPAAPEPQAGDATLRIAATIDPTVLIGELSLQARVENGEVTGYRLRAVRSGGTAQRLGLQPGDVLLAVNNRRLIDDERVAELMGELSNRAQAEITFERDGVARTITVRMTPP